MSVSVSIEVSLRRLSASIDRTGNDLVCSWRGFRGQTWLMHDRTKNVIGATICFNGYNDVGTNALGDGAPSFNNTCNVRICTTDSVADALRSFVQRIGDYVDFNTLEVAPMELFNNQISNSSWTNQESLKVVITCLHASLYLPVSSSFCLSGFPCTHPPACVHRVFLLPARLLALMIASFFLLHWYNSMICVSTCVFQIRHIILLVKTFYRSFSVACWWLSSATLCMTLLMRSLIAAADCSARLRSLLPDEILILHVNLSTRVANSCGLCSTKRELQHVDHIA